MIPIKRPSSQLSDFAEASRQSRKLRTADAIEDYASLVGAVFHNVCNEFDKWSKKALAEAKQRMTTEENLETLFEGTDSLTTDTQALTRLHTISLQDHIEPVPSYESCTPMPNNQFVGDDPNYIPFIPLADDPAFDWKVHSEKYKGFSWQTNFFDSDRKLFGYVLYRLL